MRKILAIGALAIGLAGCTTLNNLSTIASGSVSPQQVLVAANAFDAIEVTATNYLSLPTCPVATPICKTAAVAKTLVADIRTGRSARNQLEAYMTVNPGQVVPVSNYNVLISAVNTLQTLLANYNAK
jgi:hypothetical protein